MSAEIEQLSDNILAIAQALVTNHNAKTRARRMALAWLRKETPMSLAAFNAKMANTSAVNDWRKAEWLAKQQRESTTPNPRAWFAHTQTQCVVAEAESKLTDDPDPAIPAHDLLVWTKTLFTHPPNWKWPCACAECTSSEGSVL